MRKTAIKPHLDSSSPSGFVVAVTKHSRSIAHHLIMRSNTAASMFGGAGGRGSRASVASFEGLRNVLRYHSELDSAPARAASPATTSVVPADDRETLRGLNGRLSGYLDKVKQLEDENQQLKEEIDEILVKRKTAEGRDWQELEKPLNPLKNKVDDTL